MNDCPRGCNHFPHWRTPDLPRGSAPAQKAPEHAISSGCPAPDSSEVQCVRLFVCCDPSFPAVGQAVAAMFASVVMDDPCLRLPWVVVFAGAIPFLPHDGVGVLREQELATDFIGNEGFAAEHGLRKPFLQKPRISSKCDHPAVRPPVRSGALAKRDPADRASTRGFASR